MNLNTKLKTALLFLAVAIASTLSAGSLPMFPQRYTPDWAFSISNNLNPSQVVYAVHIVDVGRLRSTNPVYNYMHRKSGENPRELSVFENANAYGIRSQKFIDESTTQIVLEKYPSLPITIRITKRYARAYIVYEGKEYQLKSIYIRAKEELMGIKVMAATLVLYDSESNKSLTRLLK